jgi:hypothetical protein
MVIAELDSSLAAFLARSIGSASQRFQLICRLAMSFANAGNHQAARTTTCGLLRPQPYLPIWQCGESMSSAYGERSYPMGAIAEAIVAYAQPLLDQTDGALDQMNRAMAVAQVCWNLAISPEGQRDAAIDKLKPAFEMTDEEFTVFRQHIILPMIQRHREMFPGMHAHSRQSSNSRQTSKTPGVVSAPTKKRPGTSRNAPCPCGSGRKYKRCCGAGL